MSAGVTAEELDALTCDCGRADCCLVMRARCHKTAPVEVRYWRHTKTIQATCTQCGRLVAEIAVAQRGQLQ